MDTKKDLHSLWTGATAAATLPYLAWMAMLLLLPAQPAFYALRTVCVAFLLVPAVRAGWGKSVHRGTWLWGIAAGLGVFLLWVAPEGWGWYRKWCILGSTSSAANLATYAPGECGWGLTIMRLIGSAFVIAPAEELFFRGFLYRRLQDRDWQNVPRTHFDASAFLWTVGLFALEHNRWVAGAVAGAAYGWVYLRQGLGAAVLAHVVTNLVLGVYVIHFGLWAFW